MAKMTKEMNQALNEQLKCEIESSYIYLAMSYYFAEKNLKNLSTWFKRQSEEETEHSEKIANHILDRNGHVDLKPIQSPNTDLWKSTGDVLQVAYEHEQFITQLIHDLVILSNNIPDIAVKPLLDWFVNEQIEEEANTRDLVEYQKGYSNDFLFDHRVERLVGAPSIEERDN